MAYIRMNLLENTIKEKVEIITHELLPKFDLLKHVKDNTLILDLPGPITKLRIVMGAVLLSYNLQEEFIIKIERTPNCCDSNGFRKCFCFIPDEVLKIKVNYFKNNSIACSKKLDDRLLKTIDCDNLNTMQNKEKPIEKQNHVREKDSMFNDIILSKSYTLQIDTLLEKEFNDKIDSRTNETVFKWCTKKAATPFKVIKSIIKDVFKFGRKLIGISKMSKLKHKL